MSAGRDLSLLARGLREWLSPPVTRLEWVDAGGPRYIDVAEETPEGEAAGLVVADVLVTHLIWLREQFKAAQQQAQQR